MRPGRLVVVLVVAVVLGVAACSSSPPPATRPSVPGFAAATASAVPEISAAPKDCGTVAEAADVDHVTGHQLNGAMVPVVGVPLPSIKRTARLDCYYGVPGGQPLTAAAVSIGIAGYADAATAARRVEETVTSARDSGSSTSATKVGADPATLLSDAKARELVFSHGVLTVLVTARNGVLPADKIGPSLVALAQRALTAR
jgi:hypothetical protein